MENLNLIQYQCACGTHYGLERNVPTILHNNHPERKYCGKKLSINRICGVSFPNQTKRNELFNSQNIVISEE
jgi:hypothetical protein